MKNAVTESNDDGPKRLYTSVEDSPDALEQHVAAWELLVDEAAEPNPFYEPYALLAAWRWLAPQGLRVVLVWAPNALPGQPPHLAGLFPIVRDVRYRGLPITVFSTWHHLYSYLAVPLVRAGLATPALQAFFEWLRDNDATLFECQEITANGAFRHALIDTLNGFGSAVFHDTSHTRAYFRPSTSVEQYFEHSVSGKKRKELRRQERRLGELGTVVYDRLEAGGDLEAWVDEFVALEAQGWKGKSGTALGHDAAALRVFREYARGAHARQRWMMFALRVDGRAIAMKCNLLAGRGAVAFKIAHDESYARFSPGVLLELEHVRRLHQPGAPAWMDSGAAADHPMIGHFWRDRIAIESLLVSTGRRGGELVIAALPLVRWTSRAVKSAARRLRPRT